MGEDGGAGPGGASITWVPFLVFGLLGVTAIPLYLVQEPALPAHQGVVLITSRSTGPTLFGTFNRAINGSASTPWYWLIALIVVFALWPALSHRFERSPASHAGRWALPLSGGACLVALYVMSPPFARSTYGTSPWASSSGTLETAYVRGFLPLLVIAVGLIGFAVAKRRTGPILVAVTYLGLALLANLYDVENQTDRIVATSPTTYGLPNLLLPSALLCLSGAVMGLSAAAHRGRPREGSLP